MSAIHGVQTRFIQNLPNANMRLGLSATPELFFSEEKTNILLDFLGNNL